MAKSVRKLRWWGRWGRRLGRDQRGSTTMEWAMLLAGIGIPAGVLSLAVLNLVVEYYRMMVVLNNLPYP